MKVNLNYMGDNYFAANSNVYAEIVRDKIAAGAQVVGYLGDLDVTNVVYGQSWAHQAYLGKLAAENQDG